ncbi:MAG: IPT/TIG domain-containing protein [Sphingobacteriales bacterium]|nr:IPT/TIG domain-containing protein [Sphingobacteriales bacterium]
MSYNLFSAAGFVSLILALLFLACSKEGVEGLPGPQGPQGPPGRNGAGGGAATKMTAIDISSNSYTWVSGQLNYTINGDRVSYIDLGQNIARAIDSAGTMVYAEMGTGTEIQWMNIPDMPAGTSTGWSLGYTLEKTQQATYRLRITAQGTPTITVRKIRVVIIPSELFGEMGDGNKTAPICTIIAPQDNSSFSLTDTIHVTVTATDADGSIADVQLFVDSTAFGAAITDPPYNFTINPGTLEAGSHRIIAVAKDNGNATGADTVNVLINLVENKAPTVSFTTPKHNENFASNANITADISATDEDGTIAEVQLFIDGVAYGAKSTTPYRFTIPAGTLQPQTAAYMLKAVAKDNHGATGESSIAISITNTVTVTSFSPSSAGYGAAITVTGTGFSTVAANNIVTLNGIPAQVEAATATELKIRVPKNKNTTGILRVQVQSGGAANAPMPFTYLLTYTVSTLAGSSTEGYNDGTGVAAQFASPRSVAVDSKGNIYVADVGNNRIRKVTPGGVVTTFAGNGFKSYADGEATKASFNSPSGVAVDVSDNIYVADAGNNRIRKITPAGVVTTVAGDGTAGFFDAADVKARFRFPRGIAVDASGNIYVGDDDNNRIRKISPAGLVTTLAGSGVSGSADGTGTAAQFSSPGGVAVDASGNVYVGDIGNDGVRKITPGGVVTTLASGANILDGPNGVAIDASGNVYVTVRESHVIRKITPAGEVTLVAGIQNSQGFMDGLSTTARFTVPEGIVVDASGTIYVADLGNYRIRKIAAE